ncbi:MAG: hypothetical protein OCD76_20975 [Reichenbachiella sp.]
MNYSIPHKRQLNSDEKQYLIMLFQNSKPKWLNLIDQLTVIARCGCNDCPTILLGLTEDDQPIANQSIISELNGSDMNDQLVQVVLFGNEFKPTELEFISYGEHNLTLLPPMNWFVQKLI